MRQIGTIDKDEHAERFSDYLLTQGIGNMVEESAGPGSAWAVWVENDDHLDRARAELDQFRANPAASKYEASAEAERLRKQEAKQDERRRKKFVDVRTGWAQSGANRARPVTMTLIALSLIASLFGTKLNLVKEPTTPLENALLIAPVEQVDDDHVRWYGLSAIQSGQVWRLVTPIFLHFGPLHLLFNMMMLFSLGTFVESRRGALFFTLLVLVAAVCSNLAEYFLNLSAEPFRTSPSFGGMSGVLYALFGYAWIKGRFQPQLGIGLSQQTITIMLVWLVVCMTGLVGPIANVAHLGGLIVGVVFAYVPYAVSRVRRRR